MHRQNVISSDIQSVGYDALGQILEIRFHSGGIYQYFGIPENVHSELMNASSHGKYFNAYIKPHFNYRKIS